jgi:hypothetical protein
MMGECFFETLVAIYQITWHHIPRDDILINIQGLKIKQLDWYVCITDDTGVLCVF